MKISAALSAGNSPWPIIGEILACSIVTLMLIKSAPSLAQSLVSGTATGSGAGNLLSTIGNVARGYGAIAKVGAGMAGGATGGASSALDALRSRAGADQTMATAQPSGYGGNGVTSGSGQTQSSPPTGSSTSTPQQASSVPPNIPLKMRSAGFVLPVAGGAALGAAAGGVYAAASEITRGMTGEKSKSFSEHYNDAHKMTAPTNELNNLKSATASQTGRSFDSNEGFKSGLNANKIMSAKPKMRDTATPQPQAGDENKSALNMNGETLEGKEQS